MSGRSTLLAGLLRVLRAPHLLLLVWVAGVLVASPAAWVMREAIHDSIGRRTASEQMLESFDPAWYDEWSDRVDGIAGTFEPSVSGAGAQWNTLEQWLDGSIFDVPPALVALGVVQGLLWLLLLGGVIDRYASHGRNPGLRGFFVACGRYWFRMLRLAACALPVYAAIYLLHDRLFESMSDATRDLTREVPAITQALAVYALTALLLTLANLVFSVAKVAVVADDRRSVLGGVLRAFGFVLRRPFASLGLYYGVLLLGGAVLAGWSWFAPGVTQSTPAAIGWAFAVGQLVLLLRLALRLAVFGGFAAMYEAAPVVVAATEGPVDEPELAPTQVVS